MRSRTDCVSKDSVAKIYHSAICSPTIFSGALIFFRVELCIDVRVLVWLEFLLNNYHEEKLKFRRFFFGREFFGFSVFLMSFFDKLSNGFRLNRICEKNYNSSLNNREIWRWVGKIRDVKSEGTFINELIWRQNEEKISLWPDLISMEDKKPRPGSDNLQWRESVGRSRRRYDRSSSSPPRNDPSYYETLSKNVHPQL